MTKARIRVPISAAEVVALARAGATRLAFERLASLPPSDRGAPILLCLEGRLLKDKAVAAPGAERPGLFQVAAERYATAAELTLATYPLINAATLSALSGNAADAVRLAREALRRLDCEAEEPETPYYRAATRAEALLLLDRHGEAREAFAQAIALAPHAWEDHASTLRQFALILALQERDAGWLDAHRPPRSLHFGGHMSFNPKVVRREHLDEKIDALLEEEKIGFGYGALAAGADIIIAEAVLDRGAELHIVLPGGADAFATVSVDPFGKAWRRRFDAVMQRAATVRAVRPLATPPDKMMIDLADEVAMGAAAMNARRLESTALQLLVVPEESTGAGSPANAHARWAEAGWRQHVIAAPRERMVTGEPPRLPAAPHMRLAILTFSIGGGGHGAERLNLLGRQLLKGARLGLGPYFTGREIIVGYPDPQGAALVALSIAARTDDLAGVGIGGHYGIADPVEDPFTREARLTGEPAALAAAAAASAPPGAVCVTADFAAALAAALVEDVHAELVGELDPPDGGEPVELYALKTPL